MMGSFKKAFSKFSLSFLSGVAVGIPVYVTITDYFFFIARVEGTSMQPTLNPKANRKCDVVLLDKWNTSFDTVKRGDIVAITSPSNQNVSFIKRIIGLEGDIVETPRYRHSFVYIPKGHCWLEGDNSRASLDSNSFGPVSLGLLKGRATHIIWPPSRWMKLNDVLPKKRSVTKLEHWSEKLKEIKTASEAYNERNKSDDERSDT